jgi:3-phosphoshikimate 1-carboxyvinyltransferase
LRGVCGKDTFVTCETRSQDIDATVGCLQYLNAQINSEANGFLVSPIKEIHPDMLYALPCAESGSTLRFLLPVCGALGAYSLFHMHGRLPERPLTGLKEAMQEKGCTFTDNPPDSFYCKGKLASGTYTLPGDISSQFVSGLLFALPLLDDDSRIQISGVLESQPYVDMTLQALQAFGITIGDDFCISGNQAYRSPDKVRVEGDWSNAAFWLCAGAISPSGVTVSGLDLPSRQGDRAVTELLKRFGAKVTVKQNEITVCRDKLNGIDIDASDTPDLVPVLAAVASVADGTTVIRNAERLRIKESDRLSTVTQALTALGANVSETADGLIIHGKKKLPGGETDSFGDHRIAMMSAVLSAACTGQVVIKNAQAVNKSYPGFFEDFERLGGEKMR